MDDMFTTFTIVSIVGITGVEISKKLNCANTMFGKGGQYVVGQKF